MAGRSKGKWSRRSQNEWQSLLAKFDVSSMGVGAFCQREAISEASFYRWRRLLGNASDGAKVVGSDTAPPAFVDLGTLNGQSGPRPQLDLRLDLGDGLVLHLVRS
jgi:putative transposase